MAYGDVLQYKLSSYFDRAPSAGSTVVTFDNALTAGSVVVCVAIFDPDGGGSAGCTSGSLSLVNFPIPRVYGGSTQTQLFAWYSLNSTAGTGSATFSWTNSGSTRPEWCQFAMVEFSADSATVFDSNAVAYQRDTEDVLLAAQQYTDTEEGFSLMIGTQVGIAVPSGFQYDGSPFGPPPAITWPPATSHEHTKITDMGGMKGHTTLGSPDSDGVVGWLGKKKWSDHVYLHDHINTTYAFGAFIDAFGIILPFGHSAPLTDPSTLPAVSAVNTENSNGTGTTNTLTLSPAPVAGNLLVHFIRWSGNPGTVSVDQLVSDGWTMFLNDAVTGTSDNPTGASDDSYYTDTYLRGYWKIATGSEDTTLVMTWANSVGYIRLFAEISGTPNSATGIRGATPLYADSTSHHSFYGGISVPTETPHVPRSFVGQRQLWIVFHETASGAGYTNYPLDASWTSLVASVNGRIKVLAVDNTTAQRPRFIARESATNGTYGVHRAAMLVWRYGFANDDFDQWWDVLDASGCGGEGGPDIDAILGHHTTHENPTSSSDPGGGDAVLGAWAFVHTQAASSATWTINHNLGGYPSVTIDDGTGVELVADVAYASDNQIVVSFSSARTGKAYLT